MPEDVRFVSLAPSQSQYFSWDGFPDQRNTHFLLFVSDSLWDGDNQTEHRLWALRWQTEGEDKF